jgi:hypothetical protein
MDFADITDVTRLHGVIRRGDKWIVDICSDYLYHVGSDGNLHRVLDQAGKRVCLSRTVTSGTVFCLEPYPSDEWTQARLEMTFGC